LVAKMQLQKYAESPKCNPRNMRSRQTAAPAECAFTSLSTSEIAGSNNQLKRINLASLDSA